MTFQIDPTIKSNNVCEKIESARLEIALQILGQRKQGRTLKQVASEFDVSLGTIGNLVRFAEQKTGIKREESKYRKRMSDDQKNAAASLLEEGCSMRSAAEKVGVSFCTIQRLVTEGKLPPSVHSAPAVEFAEKQIRELEERITRMEWMAEHGIY